MNRIEANKLVKDHGVTLKNGQVMLTKPLHVFKKVYDAQRSTWGKKVHHIANLIIPVGAVVNLANGGDNKKMRASQAYCYSIVNQDTKKEVATAVSTYTSAFTYRSGKILGLSLANVKNLVLDHEKYLGNRFYHPAGSQRFDIIYSALLKCKAVPASFDTNIGTCAPGIHFFVDIEDALAYS